MVRKTLLSQRKFVTILNRLACQLIEKHKDFNNTVLIGLQPRGIFLLNRLINILEELIESLINSNLIRYEKIFNKIKEKNNIIELITLLNIFLTDAYKYQNNEKNIYFNNLEKYLSILSKEYSLDIEKFNKIINNTINNINLNGYMPLMTSGLYIDLNKQLNSKF